MKARVKHYLPTHLHSHLHFVEQCSSQPTTSAQERPKLFGNATTTIRIQNEDADDGTDRDTTDLCICEERETLHDSDT